MELILLFRREFDRCRPFGRHGWAGWHLQGCFIPERIFDRLGFLESPCAPFSESHTQEAKSKSYMAGEVPGIQTTRSDGLLVQDRSALCADLVFARPGGRHPLRRRRRRCKPRVRKPRPRRGREVSEKPQLN